MWEIFFQGHILSTIGDALRSLCMDNNKLLHMRKKWNFFQQLDAACVLCLVFWWGLYTVVSIVSWFTKLVMLYLECRHFLVVSTVHGTSIGGFVVAELVRDFLWVICKVDYLADCSKNFFEPCSWFPCLTWCSFLYWHCSSACLFLWYCSCLQRILPCPNINQQRLLFKGYNFLVISWSSWLLQVCTCDTPFHSWPSSLYT